MGMPKRSSVPDGFNAPKASETSNNQKLSWSIPSGETTSPRGSQSDLKTSFPQGYNEATAKLGDRGHSKPDNLARGEK